MAIFKDVIISIDQYDTVLKTYAWDVISLDRTGTPIYTFSKLATVKPTQLVAASDACSWETCRWPRMVPSPCWASIF